MSPHLTLLWYIKVIMGWNLQMYLYIPAHAVHQHGSIVINGMHINYISFSISHTTQKWHMNGTGRLNLHHHLLLCPYMLVSVILEAKCWMSLMPLFFSPPPPHTHTHTIDFPIPTLPHPTAAHLHQTPVCWPRLLVCGYYSTHAGSLPWSRFSEIQTAIISHSLEHACSDQTGIQQTADASLSVILSGNRDLAPRRGGGCHGNRRPNWEAEKERISAGRPVDHCSYMVLVILARFLINPTCSS